MFVKQNFIYAMHRGSFIFSWVSHFKKEKPSQFDIIWNCNSSWFVLSWEVVTLLTRTFFIVVTVDIVYLILSSYDT